MGTQTHSFLNSNISCHECTAVWDDVAFVNWGLAGPGEYTYGLRYRCGDLVRWRSDYDAGPEANVRFDSPVGVVNHGDPDVLDVVVLDSRFWPGDDLDVAECRECGAELVPLIHVSRGAFVAAIAVSPTDERVAEAVATSKATEPRSTVKWRHGVTKETLIPLDAFLDPFGLIPVQELRARGASDEALLNNWNQLDRVLLAGSQEFSNRLLYHAAAGRLNSDPLVVEGRHCALLRDLQAASTRPT